MRAAMLASLTHGRWATEQRPWPIRPSGPPGRAVSPGGPATTVAVAAARRRERRVADLGPDQQAGAGDGTEDNGGGATQFELLS